MATVITEFYGYAANDTSPVALAAAQNDLCPHIGSTCTKLLRSNNPSGVCTLKQKTREPVICCPNRLYADDYRILAEVAQSAFSSGPNLNWGRSLFPGRQARQIAITTNRHVVAVFGKGWGGELSLPQKSGSGKYFVDFILALLDPSGDIVQFVAVEVQSIDTTGNYLNARSALQAIPRTEVPSTAGFNWENVNKRILPQLIYKGHVLKQETLAKSGLYFVSPKPVFDKIEARLGGKGSLRNYPIQNGSITFVTCDLDMANYKPGFPIPLTKSSFFTTDLHELQLAFSAQSNLPPKGAYTEAIKKAL